ncbi:MAG: GNAT family N-acetyltransferase [Cyclobacteriaceae bacterium]
MLHTVALDSWHKKNSFVCEEPSLENYLRKQAGQDVKRQVAACFILEGEGGEIKGYYTLSADSVDRTLIPEHLHKKLPYKNLPVTLLGRLARDSNYKGQGIGELLLADALRRAYQASSTIGAWAVVTDPINEKALEFYQSFGFISLESGRMFIPMETIKLSFP